MASASSVVGLSAVSAIVNSTVKTNGLGHDDEIFGDLVREDHGFRARRGRSRSEA
jgi:hypothetical protein